MRLIFHFSHSSFFFRQLRIDQEKRQYLSLQIIYTVLIAAHRLLDVGTTAPTVQLILMRTKIVENLVFVQYVY